MRRRVPGGVAALCVASCTAGAPSSAPVTLQFRPTAGAAYRYALEQRVTMRPDSGTLLPIRNLTVRVYLTQDFGAPGADGIPVTSTVDSVALDSAGLPAAMRDAVAERLRGLQVRTVLDRRMRSVRQVVLNRDTDVAALAVLEQSTRGLAFPLPEGPVRIGDSWTVEVPVPTGQVLPAATQPPAAPTTITVRDVRIQGPDTTVLLSVAGRVPETAVTVELGMRQSAVRVSGTLAGDQEFSVPRGTVVRASLAWEVRLEMTLGMPDDPPVGMTLDQRLSLRMLEGP